MTFVPNATPIPPGPPPAPNRTPLYVALGALLLIVVIAVGVLALTGTDHGGSITISDAAGPGSSPSSTLPADTSVRMRGSALPAGEGDDDPAIGSTLPTLTGADPSGHPITIDAGRPQLIVVMAHWCPHCQAEVPRIVEWADAGLVPDGVDIVGVSTAVDEARGNYPPASWLEREKWPFPVLADDDAGTAFNALGASGFPTFVAVAADGTVVRRVSGEIEQDEFTALLKAALAGADTAPGGTTPAAQDTTCPEADGSSAKRQTFDGPPPMCIDPTKSYRATVDTSAGTFVLQLDAAAAPATVNNFVVLSRYHYYEGVTFHRVIANFMIQGGDPSGDGSGGPGYEFADELPRPGAYEMYSLAMANAGPDTNGSQFFIVTGDDGVQLPPSYSLFGKVVDGTDVIDAIEATPTDSDDRPTTDVVIERVQIVEGS